MYAVYDHRDESCLACGGIKDIVGILEKSSNQIRSMFSKRKSRNSNINEFYIEREQSIFTIYSYGKMVISGDIHEVANEMGFTECNIWRKYKSQNHLSHMYLEKFLDEEE